MENPAFLVLLVLAFFVSSISCGPARRQNVEADAHAAIQAAETAGVDLSSLQSSIQSAAQEAGVDLDAVRTCLQNAGIQMTGKRQNTDTEAAGQKLMQAAQKAGLDEDAMEAIANAVASAEGIDLNALVICLQGAGVHKPGVNRILKRQNLEADTEAAIQAAETNGDILQSSVQSAAQDAGIDLDAVRTCLQNVGIQMNGKRQIPGIEAAGQKLMQAAHKAGLDEDAMEAIANAVASAEGIDLGALVSCLQGAGVHKPAKRQGDVNAEADPQTMMGGLQSLFQSAGQGIDIEGAFSKLFQNPGGQMPGEPSPPPSDAEAPKGKGRKAGKVKGKGKGDTSSDVPNVDTENVDTDDSSIPAPTVAKRQTVGQVEAQDTQSNDVDLLSLQSSLQSAAQEAGIDLEAVKELKVYFSLGVVSKVCTLTKQFEECHGFVTPSS